jgi:hypothetical protein
MSTGLMPLKEPLMKFCLPASIALLTAGVIGCGSKAGTSTYSYQVELAWEAPESSTDPVVGYNVYRTAGGSDIYTLLNPTVLMVPAFTDTTVAGGRTYDYIVESVDAQGKQSLPSNTFTAVIP